MVLRFLKKKPYLLEIHTEIEIQVEDLLPNNLVLQSAASGKVRGGREFQRRLAVNCH